MIAVIDLCEEAKEKCLFSENLLKIYLYEDGELVNEMWYDDFKVEELREEGIPVISRISTEECFKEFPFTIFSTLKVREI